MPPKDETATFFDLSLTLMADVIILFIYFVVVQLEALLPLILFHLSIKRTDLEVCSGKNSLHAIIVINESMLLSY